MTTTELLSLLQFNQRWAVRTLPSGLSTVADRQHLLGLYAGIEAGEEVASPTIDRAFRLEMSTALAFQSGVTSRLAMQLGVQTSLSFAREIAG